MSKVSILIPVYNEEKRGIEKNIRKVINETKKLKDDFEIIIVNDASTDNTRGILKKINGIKIINFDEGPTRRENLAKSFKESTGEIIIFMDADLSVDLKYLEEIIQNIKDGADISIGSRYSGITPERDPKRLVISFIYNKFMQIVFSSRIKDHQCGFKAFKRKLLPLIDEMGFDLSRGWFWDVEFLVRAQKSGYKVNEFPVIWVRGEKSSFNIKREVKMIPHILRFIFSQISLK